MDSLSDDHGLDSGDTSVHNLPVAEELACYGGRDLLVNIEALDAVVVGTLDICQEVVAYHDGLLFLQLVRAKDKVEHMRIGLLAENVGADDYIVKVIVKSQHLELGNGEVVLSIGEQKNLLALCLECIHQVLDALVELDELCGQTTEGLGGLLCTLQGHGYTFVLIQSGEHTGQVDVNVLMIGICLFCGGDLSATVLFVLQLELGGSVVGAFVAIVEHHLLPQLGR